MHWPQFDLHAMLAEIHRDIGWIKGRLSANTERLDRIEARVDRPRLSWQDIQPWVIGALLLVAAAAGKLELALGILSGR